MTYATAERYAYAGETPGCHNRTVIDLDTGQQVRDVVWVDLDKGLLARYVAGFSQTVIQQGRFRIDKLDPDED